MQPLMQDATCGLLRAIRASLAVPMTLEEVRSRAWASVTFVGARHELSLKLDGDGAAAAADQFVAGLEAAEFALRGHIVADIHLEAQQRGTGPDGAPFVRLRIEALTVEDA